MDCDKVFGVLVSGPFPSGAPIDDAVERHLYECASCSDIAESLRPAPDLFHEALTPREAESLPGYHGSFGCDALVPGFAAGRSARVSDHGPLAPAVERPPVSSHAPAAKPLVAKPAGGRSWIRTLVVIGAVSSAIAATNGFGW